MNIKDKIKYRTLTPSDMTQMHRCFNKAFEDYEMASQLNFPQFSQRMRERLNVDFSLSMGAFLNRQMIGFLFTTLGKYEEKKTAYNCGTGVVFEYRGMDITNKLYKLLIPLFKKKSIKQCVLEVMITNEAAIQAYKKIGFKVSRELACLRLYPSFFTQEYFDFENVQKSPEISLEDIDAISTEKVSFLNSSSALQKTLPNEKKIGVRIESDLVAYAIYQKETARLDRFGVIQSYTKKNIGKMLIDYIYQDTGKKEITILNVDIAAKDTVQALNSFGFENQFSQFEMNMSI